MTDPDRLIVDFSLRDAVALHLFLLRAEDELPEAAAALGERIRAYLYDRLSVEEMERPEELLARLGRER